jgi:DNA-binding HxlR family transcriptional regulator
MDKNKPELGPLIELVHHRWNIPVIAELYRRSGAKYVTLVNSLDVSRASLSTSLNDLIDQGLVRRNTGHGHPMRPEYLLTEDGLVIGEHCLLRDWSGKERRRTWHFASGHCRWLPP